MDETHPLYLSVRALSDVCDGAVSRDRQGYNGSDSKFGNRLARIPPQQWTPAMQREAWLMLAKYTNQLAAHGHVYDEIPAPLDVPPLERMNARPEARRILLGLNPQAEPVRPAPLERLIVDFNAEEGTFVFRFPYNAQLVAHVRSLPNRAFRRVPQAEWVVPSRPIAYRPILHFVETDLVEHDGTLTEAAANALWELSANPLSLLPERHMRMEGDNLLIVFPREFTLESEVRNLPGVRFNREYETWAAAIRPATAPGILTFGERHGFAYPDGADRVLQHSIQQAENLLEESRADTADLQIAGLGGELRPFQKAGVAYTLKTRRTFLADAPGLGKTVQSLAALHAAGTFPAVIVCPATLKLNWYREARRWLPNRSVRIIDSRHANYDADILIINYDLLKVEQQHQDGIRVDVPVHHLARLLERNPQAVVFDEFHYTKNHKARRSRACKLLAQNASLRLGLTGTAVMNRPSELISQLDILGRLDDMGGFWHFAERYCRAHRTSFGLDLSGSDNLVELNQKLRSTCYIRREKKDVLKELPAKQRSIVPVSLSNRAEYERAERDVVRWIAERAAQEAAFNAEIANLNDQEQQLLRQQRAQDAQHRAQMAEHLVRMTTLKQIAARGKLRDTISWIQDFLESGEKLVVFAHHEEIVDTLAAEFQAPKITGSVDQWTRQDAVDQFQDDPDCRLIVLNLQAGGVGLTLTASSNVMFVEMGWTPALHEQAEDRCHRIGQEDRVNAWYLVAEETIDEDVYDILEKKREVVDAANIGTSEQMEGSVLKELTGRLLERAKPRPRIRKAS